MTFPYGRVSKPLHFIGKKTMSGGWEKGLVSGEFCVIVRKLGSMKSVLQRSLSGLDVTKAASDGDESSVRTCPPLLL